MHQQCCVFEHVVDSLDDTSFSEHDFVPHGHEPVLHVSSDSRYQVYAILEEHVKEFWRDVSSVCEEFAVEFFSQYGPDLRIPVVHVGSCETEGYDFPSVVTHEVKFETMAPAHRPLAVCGQSLENLVCIAAEVMAYGHHRGIHETDAGTATKGREV